MRAFVALELPDAVRDAVAQIQLGLPGGRAVPAENLHLTLAFLDDQPMPVLAALHDELLAMRAGPVRLELGPPEILGKPGNIVLGLRAEHGLTALHGAVLAACRAAGIALSRRRFHPHVTLMRLRKGEAESLQDRLESFLRAHAGQGFEPCEIDHVTLMRSDLHREGACYTPLSRIFLTE